MLVRMGNIITNGKESVRVAPGFSAWHSDMTISEVPGERVEPVPIPTRSIYKCLS